MRHVLSVTSECVPLVKTGGLADVAGALPAALAPHGWDMRTLLPGYPSVMKALGETTLVRDTEELFGGAARLLDCDHHGLRLYILDAPHLYDRAGGPYNDENGRDYPDNPERFAALCTVAADIARNGADGWMPEIVHCHDWQAGFAPYYLKDSDVGTIMTIHNIAFHGLAPAFRLEKLGLSQADFNGDGFEYWGNISALKAGLVFADRVTTVSPTYAGELTTPEFGLGMDGVLRMREGDLVGILNGIDLDVWNPETDAEIETYTGPEGKSSAKAALQKELGLPHADGPLAVVVSRLSGQKGLDMLLQALPALIDRGGQFALLGSGDKGLEHAYRQIANHPNIAVHIGYDEALSHRMIAGADAILVPSRFEPCGLTQLYGLRYGTIPVVTMTGGLVDTVIPANPMSLRSGVATGIQVQPLTAHGLANALTKLVELYHDKEVWAQMQANAMQQEVGWSASAGEYARLYEEVAAAS